MTVEITDPKTWLDAELTELQHAISSIDEATENQSEIVTAFEKMGCVDTARDMRASLAKGHGAALNDMRKTFSYRVTAEKPDAKKMWPGSKGKEIRTRIQAMQEHGYSMDLISVEYGALAEAKD